MNKYLAKTIHFLYIFIRYAYVFIFARPKMQFLNNVILKLAMHGRGYKNHGFVEAGEDHFFKLLAQHNPKLCIDIGANNGIYAQQLPEKTNSSVISFEPLPVAFLNLKKLENTYPDRFIAINKGVGNINQKLEIRFGKEDSEHASFCLELNEIDYIKKTNINALKVDVVTLDSYIENNSLQFSTIDLLKIDTEGYEYECLVGAKSTIKNMSPKFIQIEYNWHQLFKAQSLYKLSQLLPNYKVYQMLPYGSGLTMVDVKRPESNIYEYSNFIFARKDLRI